MSDAFAGVGTVFKRGNGASTEVFAAIAEVNSIDGPNMSRETIDVTSLDSTGGYREFIGSFRDGGEVSLEMNFTRDGYLDMKTDFESSSLVNYQIVLADSGATTFEFAGFVTALGSSVTTDDKVTSPCTIKVSGSVSVSS
jgi:predicted secreted protein